MALGLLIPQFTPEVDLGDYATQTWVNSQLSGYSKTGHTHSNYASSSHTHTYSEVGAAASNHTHSNYASSSHTHTLSSLGAASSSHTHGYSDLSGVAASSHTHSGYASSSHTHSYSDVGAASSSHTHSLSSTSITGTLPASKGGTGYTSLASLKTALGISESGQIVKIVTPASYAATYKGTTTVASGFSATFCLVSVNVSNVMILADGGSYTLGSNSYGSIRLTFTGGTAASLAIVDTSGATNLGSYTIAALFFKT